VLGIISQGKKIRALICGNVADFIPRIFRDWRQTAALGGLRLRTRQEPYNEKDQLRGHLGWSGERALQDSNLRPSDQRWVAVASGNILTCP
jgi:hypothetical protein